MPAVKRKRRLASKSALFAAVKGWDSAAVEAILEVAPELIEATDLKGRGPLHIACAVKPARRGLGEPNGIRTVKALLRSGASLEAEVPMNEEEGDFRATALWYAVARGENLPLIRFLLRRGADASYSLWAAVWRDDDEMLRELLRAKPRLNLRSHGETPIFYAARFKRLKTLELLIAVGADPSIVDGDGRDAVEIARLRRVPPGMIALMELLRN
jgi:uncharacterized protein